jgi:hypothetical protein
MVPLTFRPYPPRPSDEAPFVTGHTQLTLVRDVLSVFQYPYSGSDITNDQYLEYLLQLRVQEQNIPLLEEHRLLSTRRPAEIWKHHPAVIAARTAFDDAVAARAGGDDVTLPELPKFTTPFPAMPQRSLLCEQGDIIWPFHVVPWESEVTEAPTIHHTNEDGIRIVRVDRFASKGSRRVGAHNQPHPYAYNAIYSILPSIREISLMYELCPQSMWPQPSQSNMSGGNPIKAIDEMYNFLPFWAKHSAFHQGFHPRGAALAQARGPNICLVVRDAHSTQPQLFPAK